MRTNVRMGRIRLVEHASNAQTTKHAVSITSIMTRMDITSVPAACQPRARRVPAAFQQRASNVPASCQQRASSVPAACYQRASNVPATCQQRANSVPAACRQRASNVPAACYQRASSVSDQHNQPKPGQNIVPQWQLTIRKKIAFYF